MVEGHSRLVALCSGFRQERIEMFNPKRGCLWEPWGYVQSGGCCWLNSS